MTLERRIKNISNYMDVLNFYKYKFISLIIFLCVCLGCINNFKLDDLNGPDMFFDEICSYNGIMKKRSDINGKTIYKCECQKEYTTLDKIYFNRTINGVNVECNYERKRRFIALFLSIFLPFGIDYLYLNRYFFFILIFVLCLTMSIGNCFRFAISQNTDDYFKESKWNIFFTVFAVAYLIFWVINIILIGTGTVTDSYSVETVPDLDFLVNLNTGN